MIPSRTGGRPPRKVKSMTFIIRINGNEPSTMHAIQPAGELEHREVLRVRLQWIRSRVLELNTRDPIRRGLELHIRRAEPCRTFGHGHENARDMEYVVLSVGCKEGVNREQFVRIHGVGEGGC